MKKGFYSLLFFAIISAVSAQEKIKYFDLSYTDKKIENSLYSNIKFLDSREDTSGMGIVRVGTLNKEAVVRSNGSFQGQLENLLSQINGSNTSQNNLLFQLRRLKFVEKAGEGKEYGYIFFRANLFSINDEIYNKIASIDTFIVVESIDVTKPLMEEGNNAIVNFIKSGLVVKPNIVSSITMKEIMSIDSIEKLKIKVYNVESYTNGVYKTFMAFKAQTPDYTLFSITFEDGEITEIKAKSRKGKIKKIKSDNVYAIVNNGKPFVSALFGYYPLVKNNNDFYFIADDKLNFVKGQIVKNGSIFSNAEYIYSPLPITSVFEIKIDHVNGKFMRVREMKN
jgi:hypothetical protein